MNSSKHQGVFFALGAFGFWAITPIFFKWVGHISALEILSHRVIWSLVLTIIIITLTGRWPALITAFGNRKIRWNLLITTLLIGSNWGIFIWSVTSNQMISASLGYYINPLVNILLGVIFLGERLDRIKMIATVLCLIAVIFEIINFGRLPWIALALASSFGIYGLLRKKLGVDSLVGMALETGLLTPLAVFYLLLSTSTVATFANFDLQLYGQLFLAGPVTMIPLLCFAAAANRMSLTALGFFQYIGPSGMLLLAVFVYGEPISNEKLMTFAIIWAALSLLIWDSFNKLRRRPAL